MRSLRLMMTASAVIGLIVPVGAATAAEGSAGWTTRVSVSAAGAQGDGASGRATISGNGRYVSFSTDAANLAGDEVGSPALLVVDRREGNLEPVGSSWGDASFSADGQYLAFTTWFDLSIYAWDQRTGAVTMVAPPPAVPPVGGSFGSPSLSADSRYLAFYSEARNLVPDDTNDAPDVFVLDRWRDTVVRVSLAPGGVEANGGSVDPAISADGRYVAYVSLATNLVAGDANDQADVFVRDLRTGATTMADVSDTGEQPPWDGWGGGGDPTISANGRYVAFQSNASMLVPGDTNDNLDIFVRDLWRGTTTRVSVSSTGAQSGTSSWEPAMSPDGRYVAFATGGTLVRGDTNEASDVFRHDRWTGTTIRVSVSSTGRQGNADSVGPSISADGSHIAFASDASNLVPGDTNELGDVFVRDLTGR